MAKRRCPLHPDGCTKHPNPNPPRPKVPHPNPRRRTRPPLRGSIATHVEIRHEGRRYRVRRKVWEAPRG